MKLGALLWLNTHFCVTLSHNRYQDGQFGKHESTWRLWNTMSQMQNVMAKQNRKRWWGQQEMGIRPAAMASYILKTRLRMTGSPTCTLWCGRQHTSQPWMTVWGQHCSCLYQPKQRLLPLDFNSLLSSVWCTELQSSVPVLYLNR